jgi:hypothetical protein
LQEELASAVQQLTTQKHSFERRQRDFEVQSTQLQTNMKIQVEKHQQEMQKSVAEQETLLEKLYR